MHVRSDTSQHCARTGHSVWMLAVVCHGTKYSWIHTATDTASFLRSLLFGTTAAYQHSVHGWQRRHTCGHHWIYNFNKRPLYYCFMMCSGSLPVLDILTTWHSRDWLWLHSLLIMFNSSVHHLNSGRVVTQKQLVMDYSYALMSACVEAYESKKHFKFVKFNFSIYAANSKHCFKKTRWICTKSQRLICRIPKNFEHCLVQKLCQTYRRTRHYSYSIWRSTLHLQDHYETEQTHRAILTIHSYMNFPPYKSYYPGTVDQNWNFTGVPI